MSIEIEHPGPPVDDTAVDAFQATLPGTLPPSYRGFLLAHNGGEPEPNWWPPEAGDADVDINAFYSLVATSAAVSLSWARMTYRGRVPEHLLAIAYDSGGNQIGLSLTGDDAGTVWFWDHELEVDDDQEPHPTQLIRVAAGFADFLDTLEPLPEDEDEIDRRTAAARREQ